MPRKRHWRRASTCTSWRRHVRHGTHSQSSSANQTFVSPLRNPHWRRTLRYWAWQYDLRWVQWGLRDGLEHCWGEWGWWDSGSKCCEDGWRKRIAGKESLVPIHEEREQKIRCGAVGHRLPSPGLKAACWTRSRSWYPTGVSVTHWWPFHYHTTCEGYDRFPPKSRRVHWYCPQNPLRWRNFDMPTSSPLPNTSTAARGGIPSFWASS